MYSPLILLFLLFMRFSCKEDRPEDHCKGVSCAGDTLNSPLIKRFIYK